MLENKYGWRDVRHLSVEHKEEQRLIVIASPELAEKLARDAGDSISFEVSLEEKGTDMNRAVYQQPSELQKTDAG